jgi:3-methyladenine DNA glycosylase AlkD
VHPTTQTIVSAFTPLASPAAAVNMAAYMRDQFPFLGISAVQRDDVLKPLYKTWKPSSAAELTDVVTQLWALPEREFQYAAGRLLRRYADRVEPDILATLVRCAQDKSWWDTVDELVHPVGNIALRYPETIPTIESWITHEDFWLARMAILHQLVSKDVDLDRLARMCLARSNDPEFFIRKAIGWALRDASYQHREWVESFVAANADQLSTLSKREALKAIQRNVARASSLRDPVLRKSKKL